MSQRKLTEIHAVRSRYHMAIRDYFGKAPWEKLGLEPTLESWQRTRWPNVRVFQTREATIGKARSPRVDRFDVGTANVSDDHDRSRCLDGRSL